jgi:hypothetical protein
LYQTLANIATEKNSPYFSIPREFYLEKGRQKQTKTRKQRKEKDNTGNHNLNFLD